MVGRQQSGRRAVNGILLLDKPAGLSSNQLLQRVKRLFKARKAGHTGSLDVPATGLLPICFGEATKVSAFLLDSDKTYVATGRLGITTTTGDAAGEVLTEKATDDLSQNDLLAILPAFRGEIEQVPPMYSALKHHGKRLYELAYQGLEVERQPRKATIYQLELLDFSGSEFEIRVKCSKGTYIRTLVQDIGAALGCGAHVLSLRRLQSGPFTEEQMLSLEQIEAVAGNDDEALDSLLLPMDRALLDLPEIHLDADASHCLCLGQSVVKSGASGTGTVRLYNQANCFIGLGDLSADGVLKPKRLINIELIAGMNS